MLWYFLLSVWLCAPCYYILSGKTMNLFNHYVYVFTQRQAAQCVGRVIRSKADYGMMIFADKRCSFIEFNDVCSYHFLINTRILLRRHQGMTPLYKKPQKARFTNQIHRQLCYPTKFNYYLFSSKNAISIDGSILRPMIQP